MVQIRFPLELKTYINMMNYKIPFIFSRQKKNRRLRAFCFFVLDCTNYAATAGATRATGRDSPAARSRGKL